MQGWMIEVTHENGRRELLGVVFATEDDARRMAAILDGKPSFTDVRLTVAHYVVVREVERGR